MKLLLLLLLAAAWLAPGFAWPHNETVATGPLLDDPSDWPQSKQTDTGLAHGELTDLLLPTSTVPEGFTQVGTLLIELKPTDGGPVQGERSHKPQPTGPPGPPEHPGHPASGVVEQGDGRCALGMEKKGSANGESFWAIAENEMAQQQCNDWCAAELVAAKAGSRIGSATCSKINSNPFVDHNGVQQSGS